MNVLLFLILAISVFIETTLTPLPFTITLVSVIAIISGYYAVIPIFLAGILFDLMSLQKLGLHSILFLVVTVIATRYQRKMYIGQIWYAFMFIGVITILYDAILYRVFQPLHVVASIFFGGITLLVANRIYPFFQRKSHNISL